MDIGNTSIKLGVWIPGSLSQVSTHSHDLPRLKAALHELVESESVLRSDVVMASVVPRMTAQVEELVQAAGGEGFVIGRDVPLPIPLDVDEPETVGIDRICQAAAAQERTGHACIVISFGTAITVDLISDNGVFMGGAILPGMSMQAGALHQNTAQLPQVKIERPDTMVGRTTADAIKHGVYFGSIGAVRGLVERLATALGTWPQVVATGGDLASLADDLDFVDSLVPDLCLMGVGLAWARHRGIE